MGTVNLIRPQKNRDPGVKRARSTARAANARVISECQSLLQDGRIFWAVDPFGDSREHESEILKLIEFFNLSDQPVQPVSVVSPFDMGAPVEVFPSIEKQIRDDIHVHLDRLPALSKKLGIATPAVIVDYSSTRRQCAETLLEHLQDQKVRLITLNSSGRRGLQRLRLGSFAETLLALSPFPILVAGPDCQVPKKMAQVLFPTSLSKDSKKTFSRLVDWAKNQNAELTLYHLQDPLPPATLNAQVTEFWEKDLKEARRRARRWVHEAIDRGARCRLQIETRVAEVGERILTAAKVARADLIVMDHRNENPAQTLFNRQLRMVLAESRCPVLVMKKSEAKKPNRKMS